MNDILVDYLATHYPPISWPLVVGSSLVAVASNLAFWHGMRQYVECSVSVLLNLATCDMLHLKLYGFRDVPYCSASS